MKYFLEMISLETALRAGFNHWELSFFFVGKNGKSYLVYHAKIPSTDTNIVVIADNYSKHKDGYKRKTWYFGTFEGKHSGEYKTEAEAEPFFENIRRIITRKNRIACRDLEGLVINAVEEN